MSLKLRPWQDSAINKALNWLIIKKKDKRFLINAAPGSGKTICAAVLAKNLIDANEIERVIVIAPRREVVKQWKDEYGSVTGYSFMIYGHMTVKDNAILNKGLTLLMINEGHGELRFVQVTEEVDIIKAEAYGLMRGRNIQWVFPGNVQMGVGSMIHKTIEEGLTFLRLSHHFLGTMGGAGNVTNV